MNPDRFWIITAILVISFVGWNFTYILEEWKLLSQLEDFDVSNELNLSYFYPLTQEERILFLENKVQQINQFQEAVSESRFLKHFIDLRDTIIALQEVLIERQHDLDTDNNFLLSFSTAKLHQVFATPEIEREHLLHLASLIDQSFSEEDSIGLFTVGYEDQHLIIEVTPIQGINPNDSARFSKFSEDVSRDVFSNEPVKVRIDPSEESPLLDVIPASSENFHFD